MKVVSEGKEPMKQPVLLHASLEVSEGMIFLLSLDKIVVSCPSLQDTETSWEFLHTRQKLLFRVVLSLFLSLFLAS